MKMEAIAIAAEYEGDIQRISVAEGLLNSSTHRVLVVFRLDDRDRDVGLVVENIVGASLLSACVEFPSDINFAGGEAYFLTDLSVYIPASRHDSGRYELGADVAFTEVLFVHAAVLIIGFSSSVHPMKVSAMRLSSSSKTSHRRLVKMRGRM